MESPSVMSRSEALFERAKKTIPGGVNSPVRAFKAVGGTPRFMERADGAYLFDADGRRYIDYVLSWGPMIMGHNHPRVRDAVVEAAQGGLSFGDFALDDAEDRVGLVESMFDQDLLNLMGASLGLLDSAREFAQRRVQRP